jgi:hypothetical protein
MADRKDDAQEPVKAKVILVGVKEERNRYEIGKVLAQQLGVTFEEAAELIRELPAELIPSIPVQAGERFADMLRQVGGEVDVMSIARAAGHFCSDHSHRRARAKCKDPKCEKYICEICVRNAGGKLLCAEHYAALKRRRWLYGVGGAIGAVLLAYLVLAFGPGLTRWLSYLYVDTVRVAIVFVSRDIKANGNYYLHMTTTNNPGGYAGGDNHNYRDIEGWFQREYERVAHNETKVLSITTYGLYELADVVPRPARESRLTWTNFKLDRKFRSFFGEIERANELELNHFHNVLYVELVRDTGVENDYMEQLGFSKNGLGFVRIPTAGQLSNDYYVMCVAHYVGRLLGASLKLDAHGYPLFPTGYGEPNAQPRYPQTTAELMGCYVPVRAFEIARIESFDNAVVSPQSAREMGWISRTERDAYYQTVRP